MLSPLKCYLIKKDNKLRHVELKVSIQKQNSCIFICNNEYMIKNRDLELGCKLVICA